jgi:hypothetical protein
VKRRKGKVERDYNAASDFSPGSFDGIGGRVERKKGKELKGKS